MAGRDEADRHGPVLALVTAAHTAMCDHLADTCNSVRAVQELVGPRRVTWRLCLDGRDELDTHTHQLLATVLSDGVLQQVVSHGGPYGVSAARNTAAAGADGHWVMALDADDECDRDGMARLVGELEAEAGSGASWVATPQLMVDGTARPGRPAAVERHYAPGELNTEFVWPPAFHPNAVAYRREVLWGAGGWPALCGGEDVALLLKVARDHQGRTTTVAAVRRRFWDGQTTAQPGYQDTATRQLRHHVFEQLGVVGGRQRGDDGLLW